MKKNHRAQAWGRLGGLKGGKARAKKLTPERRKEIARNAALVRWRNPYFMAITSAKVKRENLINAMKGYEKTKQRLLRLRFFICLGKILWQKEQKNGSKNP